ncbi:MAG: hypothetical protein WC528_05120 [Patescibacteria group bacterium]
MAKKSIRGLFVKTDGQAPRPGSPSGSAWAPPAGTGFVPGSAPKSYLDTGPRRGQSSGNATAVTSTAVDTQFTAEIEEQLRTVPTPKGFDMFLGALENLTQFIPDEGNRFKAAMVTAAASGLTPAQIVEALEAQLAALEKILATFQSDLETEANESIAERESQLKTLATQIGDLQRQLADIQREMQKLSDDQRRLQDENAQVEQRKSLVTNRYSSAHAAKLGKTQELLSKVQRYLGQ